MDVPVRQLPLDHVWLDYPRRERLLALLLVFDLDEPALTDALAERADELFLGARGPRLGRLGKVELAERLLELATDPVERRVRVGGDHRPDELEREPDRARLERRQARRGAGGAPPATRAGCGSAPRCRRRIPPPPRSRRSGRAGMRGAPGAGRSARVAPGSRAARRPRAPPPSHRPRPSAAFPRAAPGRASDRRERPVAARAGPPEPRDRPGGGSTRRAGRGRSSR